MTSTAPKRTPVGPALALLTLATVGTACDEWPWPFPPTGDGGAPPARDVRPPPPVDAGDELGNRPIDCARWRTVKEMDNFFLQRCGGDTAQCHSTAIFGTSYKDPDVYKRLLNSPSTACPDVNLADRNDHTRGSVWAKTRDVPTCLAGRNAGRSAGTRMPAKKPTDFEERPLTSEEHRCLESYLRALTDGGGYRR